MTISAQFFYQPNPEKAPYSQLGKEDKEGNGDGTEWESDVAHIEKMCQEISQIDDLAFIVVTGDFAHAIPNDEVGVNNPGSNPPLRPVKDLRVRSLL